LRAYVLAKLLWNPACNVDRIINDFLKGFYGAAAGPLRQYIDLQHDALAKSGAKLQIFGGPADHRQGYLSRELVQRCQLLFDEAEQRTQEDPECLARVQMARLPLFYVQLQLGYGGVEDRLRDAQRLFATAQRAGLLMFNEWNLPVERYRQQVMDQLQKEKAMSLTK
jgi:hypothetical protein